MKKILKKTDKISKSIFLLMFLFCDIANANYVNKAIESIKKHEGFSDVPYLCTNGYKTIGYGFRVENVDKKYSDKMTTKEADVIIKELVENYITIVKSWLGSDVFESLSDNQKIVFLDMTYNLGNRIKAFKKLKLAIQDKNINKIKKEMKESDWCYQVKSRCVNLVSLI